jgi:AbrB family looped-hinge helix DNA binding protein
MTRVRLSSKFQIVIPREIRERLRLRPGQQMTLLERGNTITVIPDQPLEKLRGTLKGAAVDGLRERRDRL